MPTNEHSSPAQNSGKPSSQAGRGFKLLLGVFLGIVVVSGMVWALWAYRASFTGNVAPQEPERVDVPALEQKASAGDVSALLKLGHVYASGSGVNRDLKKAASLYQEAVDKGDAEAMAALGELYQSGRLGSNGLTKAVELYQKAANLGSVAGQYDLAYLYEQGRGVVHDSAQAAKYYLLAAEGGDSTAQYDIGQRYALGVGMTKDLVEAYKWLTLASHSGVKSADKKLEKLVTQMNAAQIDEAKQRVSAFKPRTSS